MENIPEVLCTRLIHAGYVSVETLPNADTLSRWENVKGDCEFSDSELNIIINAVFPSIQTGLPMFYVTKPQTNGNFPPNGQPKILLSRKKLVQEICDTIVDPKLRNYYIRGPRSSGKSVLLDLVGMNLMEKGFDVYKVDDALSLDTEFPKVLLIKLEESLKKFGKRAFLLVDGLQNDKDLGVWTYLLKSCSHIITIGFGNSSPLSDFSDWMKLEKIFSTECDILEDANGLKLFESIFTGNYIGSDLTDDDTKRVVTITLLWLLSYTGEHTYPFVKLAEYLLSKHAEECNCESWGSVVGGHALYRSEECQLVINRSFNFSSKVRVASDNILQFGRKVIKDEQVLFDAGYWNSGKQWFLSDLMLYYILNEEAKPVKVEKVDILNILQIGFGTLNEGFLVQCDKNMNYIVRYEDSIEYYFAWCLSRIDNILISPQHIVTSSDMVKCGKKTSSSVVFYINGNVDTYFEFIRNVDKESLKEHFDRFIQRDGKHAGRSVHSKYVVVDIHLNGMVPVQLPTGYEQYGDHYWSFVKKDNNSMMNAMFSELRPIFLDTVVMLMNNRLKRVIIG